MDINSNLNETEIKFLEGRGRDNKGRYIGEMLKWGEFWLELKHDYIQRVFPLNEPSLADPDAPVLSEADVEYLRNSEPAKVNIRQMYQKMLEFYKLDDNNYKNWGIHRYWNTANNHNHLRITRMLKCFRLLGMKDEHEDLSMRLRYLLENERSSLNISPETYDIWFNEIFSVIQEEQDV